MSIKTKLVAAGAALTLLGGTVAALAMTGPAANAETPPCGNYCTDIFSHSFGKRFVLSDYKRAENIGNPLILFQASNADPGEDFAVADYATVDQYYKAGLASPALDLHYASDLGFELEYAPYGADTGLCAGVAVTAFSGEKITLQPCGVSGKTVWVLDSTTFTSKGVAFVNGSDMSFSFPLGATYPAGSVPTDSPRPALYVAPVSGFFGGSVTDSSQLWKAATGTLP